MTLLTAADSQLVIVDIQERLAPAIHESAAALKATLLLVGAAKRLGVPICVTEQYPKGLGPSVRDLLTALRRMERAGIHMVTSEMVVFEWMERAGTDDFKAIAPLLK